MKIIQHKRPKKIHKYGAILYPFKDWKESNLLTGCKWFSKFDPKILDEKGILYLNAYDYNHWETLKEIGIENALEVSEELKYECPWSNNHYYWFYPTFLLYSNQSDWDKHYYGRKDYYFDKEWHLEMFLRNNKKKQILTNKIDEAFLGHGYTGGTFPNDGSGHLEDAVMALDNGDFLAGKIWVWFNK